MKNLSVKNFIKRIIILVLIISQVFVFAACGEQAKQEFSYGEDWLLNTFCYIKIFEPGKDKLIADAFALAREYEGKLSRTISTSQISTGVYDDETQSLVDLALDFEAKTDGAFCIHLGSVSELWDFSGSNGGPFVPESFEIAEALAKQSMDLGAIAKGYIADRVSEFLQDGGVNSAIISLGGNIICIGLKPDGSNFVVGIEKPFSDGEKLEDRESIGTVSCEPNYSVVTSGIYERCFTDAAGKFYHHILDSRTGQPAEVELSSASVIGPSSCICDALATISILLGPSKALDFFKGYPDYKAVFITTQGDIIDSFDLL